MACRASPPLALRPSHLPLTPARAPPTPPPATPPQATSLTPPTVHPQPPALRPPPSALRPQSSTHTASNVLPSHRPTIPSPLHPIALEPQLARCRLSHRSSSAAPPWLRNPPPRAAHASRSMAGCRSPYISLCLPIPPYTSLYRPIIPYTSLHLPIPLYISSYLPIPPYTSLYLPIPPNISLDAGRRERACRGSRARG